MTSIWPRSGGDAGNRSQSPVCGPAVGRIAKRVHVCGLLSARRGPACRIAGGAVAGDGTLRVAFRGLLYSLSADGEVSWSLDLRLVSVALSSEPDYVPEKPAPEIDPGSKGVSLTHHSLPSIVGRGDTLIAMNNTAAVIDTNGHLAARIEVPLMGDSGPAPNLDRRGIPILTTIGGGVLLREARGLEAVGYFGYDVVPVAVFEDNSFAVSGYYGSGFCRVRPDGTILWRGELKEADLLPTVSSAQLSAVGSLNEACSGIFSPEGTLLGTYPRPAAFAEYVDGGWITLAEDTVARLSPCGAVQWSHPVTSRLEHGCYQPIVDPAGRVYVIDANTIVAFDGDGRKVFSLEVGEEPGPLFPVRAGVLATVVGEELLFVE